MNGLGRFVRTAARVSRTRYPAFIFGRSLAAAELPVFTYHDVEADDLVRDLTFLRDNGYRALGLTEYLDARAAKSPRGRSVLLTFDDARKSFYDVALPLLESFNTRAVLFAPTYWMQPPILRYKSADSGSRDMDDLFMSWQQLRDCAASGLVDVQSHAHRHALVAIAPGLVDFANPAARRRFDIYDWPMRFVRGEDELGSPALGTPVYRSTPLLSAPRRYLESGELTEACRDFVARSGGADFFAKRDWRARLCAFHSERARKMVGRYMKPDEFRELVASEFERSREEFRTQLGYAPACIAYPWMLGSEQSLELAKHHGLRVAFGVALDYRAERRGRLPLPVYGRLKCDWLRFLPGRDRSSVFTVLGRKLTGFARVQHLAH